MPSASEEEEEAEAETEAAVEGDASGALLPGPAVSLRNRPSPSTPRSGFRVDDGVGVDFNGCDGGFNFIDCF